jgi:hypothetical protein
MSLLQGLIVLLLVGAWGSALLKFSNRKINLGEFLLWSALWLVLLVASLFPQAASSLSALLGIGRGVDMIMYGSIFVLFFLMFKLYVRMEGQEREVTSLVREVAIRRARKK